MKSIPFLFVLTCLPSGHSNLANAQQSLGIGPVTGGSFDRFGDLRQGPAAFTFRHSRLTGAGPGEDVAVRLFPQALAARVALIGADVGIMQAVARGPVALFVKAGASPIIQLDFHHPEIIPGCGGGIRHAGATRATSRATDRRDPPRFLQRWRPLSHLEFRRGVVAPAPCSGEPTAIALGMNLPAQILQGVLARGALVLLRIQLGVVFLVAGIPKIRGDFTPRLTGFPAEHGAREGPSLLSGVRA